MGDQTSWRSATSSANASYFNTARRSRCTATTRAGVNIPKIINAKTASTTAIRP
jgi:hypothetical protein